MNIELLKDILQYLPAGAVSLLILYYIFSQVWPSIKKSKPVENGYIKKIIENQNGTLESYHRSILGVEQGFGQLVERQKSLLESMNVLFKENNKLVKDVVEYITELRISEERLTGQVSNLGTKIEGLSSNLSNMNTSINSLSSEMRRK